MEPIIQLNSEAKLSDHFTLGEMTKSSSHPEVYNIPSHEAIANLKRLCGWLEVLRKRYGAIWLHFAVRPFSRSATQGDACQSKNRRKVAFIQA